MLILQRLRSGFAIYFSKGLETSPLSKVKQNLITFMQTRPPKQQFQSSFSAYQIYLHQILEDNPKPNPIKLDIFDLVTRIHANYQLPSKKLLRLQNRWADECLQFVNKQQPEELIRVLGMMQRYNKGKALALFKSNKETIVSKLRQFSPLQTVQLLSFLKEAQIDDSYIRQTALEVLFPNIQFLNLFELHLLLEGLAFSKKYINREFLARVGQRLLTLYRCGNVADKNVYGMLAWLSEIEANLHTRAVYVQELNPLYELALPGLFTEAQHLSDSLLNRLVSSLRRSKFFEEPLLAKLSQIGLQRTIVELSDERDGKQKMGSSLTLRTFLNIVHTHAVFNYHDKQFKDYLMEVLKIIMMREQELIPANSMTKLVWSLCVLFEREQLRPVYPLIDRYLTRAERVPLAEATNMYYCYLYLRTSCTEINVHRDKIHSFLEKHSLETHSSNIQMEVYNNIIEAGVPCIPEYNLNNLICDIMIPQWKDLKNVVIQMHGFRHFCRNVKRLTGSSALKEKIIKGEMYRYYYITADEWLILQDKKAFIKQFLEHINDLQEKASSQKPKIEPKTSTRVRGQVRKFRVSRENQLLQ